MSDQYIDIGGGRAVKEDYFKSLWSCKRCGKCCNKDGFLVTSVEITRLSALAGLSKSEFKRLYIKTKKIDNKWCFSCRQPCLFYNVETGCEIYDYRPEVCRLFPFVDKVVANFCPAVAELQKSLLEGIDEIEDGLLKA